MLHSEPATTRLHNLVTDLPPQKTYYDSFNKTNAIVNPDSEIFEMSVINNN